MNETPDARLSEAEIEKLEESIRNAEEREAAGYLVTVDLWASSARKLLHSARVLQEIRRMGYEDRWTDRLWPVLNEAERRAALGIVDEVPS